MFVAKLKLAIGAVMIVTALGASGLVYRAAGQSAPTEKRSDGKPLSEVGRLRRENELLKLNLDVVLEKVRAQQAELHALRGVAKSAEKTKAEWEANMEKIRSDLSMWEERAAWSERMSRQGYVTRAQAERDQARLRNARFDEAEAALKALREARDAESRQRAADALDKALKKLREQMKKPESGKR